MQFGSGQKREREAHTQRLACNCNFETLFIYMILKNWPKFTYHKNTGIKSHKWSLDRSDSYLWRLIGTDSCCLMEKDNSFRKSLFLSAKSYWKGRSQWHQNLAGHCLFISLFPQQITFSASYWQRKSKNSWWHRELTGHHFPTCVIVHRGWCFNIGSLQGVFGNIFFFYANVLNLRCFNIGSWQRWRRHRLNWHWS